MNTIDKAIEAFDRIFRYELNDKFRDKSIISFQKDKRDIEALRTLKQTHVIIPKADFPEGLAGIDFSEGSDEPYDLCDVCVEVAALVAKHIGQNHDN